MKKWIAAVLCLAVIVSSLPGKSVFAKVKPITKLEFETYRGEDGSGAFISMEEGHFLSILSYLSIKRDSKRTGFVEKTDGLFFTSSDETIVKLQDPDLGIFESLKPGTAVVTAAASKAKAAIRITVVEKGIIDPNGTAGKIGTDLKVLYEEKLTTTNVIEVYNKYTSLGAKARKYDTVDKNHSIAVPERYLFNLTWDKLQDYLEKNKTIYFSDKPFSVKTAAAKKGSIKVSLSRRLSNNDVVAYAFENHKKCTSGLKMTFRVMFYEGKSSAKKPYDSKAVLAATKRITLKSGASSFTMTLPKEVKAKKVYSVIMAIDEDYGYTLTTGSYFTAK